MIAPHSLSCKYPAVADVRVGSSTVLQVKLPVDTFGISTCPALAEMRADVPGGGCCRPKY